MDPNWTRWIHATICKLWTDYCKIPGLNLFIEGEDRDTKYDQDFIELRWNGPVAKEIPMGYWTLLVDMNVLISSILSRDDTHKHKKVVGLVQAGFVDSFSVFKYGDTPEIDDPDELLGCLQSRSNDREALTTTYFGKIDVDVAFEQSTVEAHYQMTLRTK